MSAPEVTYEVEVQGIPLTTEARIMGALVRRLGGTVSLTEEELTAVQGVVLWGRDGGIQIDAGNFNVGVAGVLETAPGDAPADQG
jgi:hypothetical protein